MHYLSGRKVYSMPGPERNFARSPLRTPIFMYIYIYICTGRPIKKLSNVKQI